MTVTDPTGGPQAPSGCAPSPTSAIGTGPAQQLAATLKALADPARLRMLSMITSSPSGEVCACDFTAVTDLSQPTISHHLKVLRNVGVVASERRGSWVHYRVADGAQAAVRTLLESFAPSALQDQPQAAGHGTERRSPARAVEVGLPGQAGEDLDALLDRTALRLRDRFPDLPADLVTRTLRDSCTALARTARVTVHLPVLAERFARERLEDVATSSATVPVPRTPQVLFVCVANAGRSQLAAALLHRHAGDRVVVRSAGSAPAADVHTTVRPLLAEILGQAPEVFPKPLTDDAVRAADVVVTMGCGDTCPVLPGIRYEDWPVPDPALASPQEVTAICEDLDRRVRALLADLLPADRQSTTDLTEEPA